MNTVLLQLLENRFMHYTQLMMCVWEWHDFGSNMMINIVLRGWERPTLIVESVSDLLMIRKTISLNFKMILLEAISCIPEQKLNGFGTM